jgi:hypothetical protein
MDSSAWKSMVWSQFAAAIKTLENAIAACPDDLLADPSHAKPFWQLVFHPLFFLDLYLSDSPKGFKPPPPFGLSELDPKGAMPDRVYSKKELSEYLEHGRAKCRAVIAALTDEKALQSCGFRWVGVNVGELMLYNMRHVQHHAAQLNLMLRKATGSAPAWVFKGGAEPA